MRKEVKHLLKNEVEKRKKLAELGIAYEFPGYVIICGKSWLLIFFVRLLLWGRFKTTAIDF